MKRFEPWNLNYIFLIILGFFEDPSNRAIETSITYYILFERNL
jgi:hypothetical protein